VLEVASDEDGVVLFAYQLFDARGRLIAESKGFKHYPNGLTIRCGGGELLLKIPPDPRAPVQYRLYNSSGRLLTWSDGSRTKIYSHLRMDGVQRGWTRNGA
jgi:hypothetical protein